MLTLTASIFVSSNSNFAAAAGEADEANADFVALVDGGGRFDVWVDARQGAGIGRLYFGDPGDIPLMGDWNCDGVDTPGVYRSSAGRVYLRNSLSSGPADRVYSFGSPGDVPLAGDFNGNGCDTVSVYRPSQGRAFISNSLSGALASSFYFGIPGDRPFVGDFNGDGVDTIGLHRESVGFVYFRNSNTAGVADWSFFYGNPGDKVIAGDWDGDGTDTVAVYRPSNGVLYLKNTNRTGVADSSMSVGSYQYAISASGVPATIANTSGEYVPDVHVYPGDDLAGLARSWPEGTVFKIHGVLKGQSVVPKDRQVFIGASDAVLDGGGWQQYAFSGSASDVVIQGLHIVDYNTPAHFGSVYVSGSGWLVEGNDIHGSAWAGIAVRDDAWTRSDPNDVPRGNVIRNNLVHDNEQVGLTVRGTVGTVIEGNEIAYNNRYGQNDWGFEAGGTKFWDTEGLIVRNNYSHDNYGPGLWDDYNNNNILYEGNLVEDNIGPGIFHEISYKATIRNNTIRRNGNPSGDPWLWGAGILIAASQDTDVYGNRLEDNSNGIALIQQNRGWGDRGEWIVRNNNVYNNVITGGISGAVQDTGDNSIFYANNRFSNNTYSGDAAWAWDNDNTMNWYNWRNTGNDTNGTYNR